MSKTEKRDLVASMVLAAKTFRRDGWECRRRYNLGQYDIAAVAARGRAKGLMLAARLVLGIWTGAREANIQRRAA